ncbi:MAG TPA: hypothetical protein VKP60_21850 [Magnetospirillaceae bacterium]|nr:hypothetical protein [Magnetospirillaceae bacterium]
MSDHRRRHAPVLLISALLAGPAFADPSAGELEFLASQARPAWLRLVEAKHAKAEPVEVVLSLRPDGKIDTARLSGAEDRYERDPRFQVVADAAVRALLQASPLTPPPGHPDFFSNNPQLTLNFDPRSMR